MAQGITFVCSHCQFSVMSWSDGNPYYRDENGKKHYAYHPNHEELAKCIGNDAEMLCLDCGHRFKSDSLKPRKRCTKCKSTHFQSTYSLAGKACPKCKQGRFVIDPRGFAIS